MSPNPPQTLSVKRKRNEAPVDSLVVERTEKRLKSDIFPGNPTAPTTEQDENRPKIHTNEASVIYRRLDISSVTTTRPIAPSATQAPRRFLIDRTTGQRILVEHRPVAALKQTVNGERTQTPTPDTQEGSTPKPVTEHSSRPRKRPGQGAALPAEVAAKVAEKAREAKVEPSEDIVRQFEQFSEQVEREESVPPKGRPSPSKLKVKPRAPKLRYKDRHPEKAQDPDAMDVDTDEYVYDTYVREIVLPDADGKIPEPQGTVGFIVINEEDEEWWNGDDESDREFDTDDEDENAEDYYANDYPEDEMSDNDEYDRDPYKYQGHNDEEYDIGDDANSDEEEGPFSLKVPVPLPVAKPARPGYWGQRGE